MRLKEALFVVMVGAAISGCATIVTGPQNLVEVSSSPSGATATIKNRAGREVHKAKTPFVVSLKAGAGYFKPQRYTVEFENEGHQKIEARIPASINPWYIGGILIGDPIGGLLVDPLSGSMWKLDDRASAVLLPMNGTSAEGGGGNTVANQILELKKLKDAGGISPEEYEEKRKPLLDSL